MDSEVESYQEQSSSLCGIPRPSCTREVSALRNSGSLPERAHQFALEQFKSQWEQQLDGNTYNEQLSNTSQVEPSRYRSESVSDQSDYSYVSANSDAYHSAPSSSSLPEQQIDKGGNQLHLPTPVVDDDVLTAAYSGNAYDFSMAKRVISRLQPENHQLYKMQEEMQQQVKRQMEEIQRQVKRYMEEMQRQMKRQIEEMERKMEEMQQRKQDRSRTQCISMEERYLMDKRPHGIAVIINNFMFRPTNPFDTSNRWGSDVDQDKLEALWKYLGYDVVVLKDRTASKLLKDLNEIAAQMRRRNCDSFVCCILSHGGLGDVVFGVDGQPVEVKIITGLFDSRNCRSLFGKPKMFFIQGCRGIDEDQGVFPYGAEVIVDGGDQSLPTDTDFLVSYSSASGMVSHRSEEHGSWYVYFLCEVLKDHAHSFHLLDMLTMVNEETSKAYTAEGCKQCPELVYRLRKQVWFFDNLSDAS